MTAARSSLFRNTVRTSLLAAALVSSTAFAGPTNVLFKAALTIRELVVPSGSNGCHLTGTFSGSGHASHLGKVSLSPLSAPDCIVLIDPLSGRLDSNFSNNHLVLQAANGDFLYVTYTGTAMQQGTLLVLTGTFTFAGGTGRFTNAIGAGTLDGVEELGISNPVPGTVMLSGKISY